MDRKNRFPNGNKSWPKRKTRGRENGTQPWDERMMAKEGEIELNLTITELLLENTCPRKMKLWPKWKTRGRENGTQLWDKRMMAKGGEERVKFHNNGAAT